MHIGLEPDAKSVGQKPYRWNPNVEVGMKQGIDQMLKAGP